MLCINTYSQTHIDQARKKVAAQLKTYQALIAGVKDNKAVEAFEPHYFNNLLIALDSHFVHRARAKEGKDGNPLNETRMLCDALINNQGTLAAEKSIKYVPDKSVLKYSIGDEIKLKAADFMLLSKAFLAEIESKYL
jgi:hypothetical protein